MNERTEKINYVRLLKCVNRNTFNNHNDAAFYTFRNYIEPELAKLNKYIHTKTNKYNVYIHHINHSQDILTYLYDDQILWRLDRSLKEYNIIELIEEYHNKYDSILANLDSYLKFINYDYNKDKNEIIDYIKANYKVKKVCHYTSTATMYVIQVIFGDSQDGSFALKRFRPLDKEKTYKKIDKTLKNYKIQ